MNGHEPINKFISYLGEDGSRAHKYWNFSGAWCCGEVAMVMKQTVGNLFYDGKKVVYCPTAYAWCKTHLQKIPTRNAQFGDIIFFDWNRNGVPDHIGMVEYVSGSTVHTLEGNTGSPARVRRRVRESYILGIFRPKYEPPKPEDYKVKVDGEWGYHTCLATQYVLGGLTLDGVLGKATIKAIQKKVGCKADGVWGTDTTKAIQRFVGAKVDGEKGKETFSKWQTWLNKEIDKKIIPTPPTPPTPTRYTGEFPDLIVHSRNYLQQVAKELAWAKGTKASKYNYKGGSATSKFKTALNKAYPNRSSWGAKSKVGASCDVFVGTCMRYSGCDTTWARGLDGQYGKTPKHCSTTTNVKEAQMLIYEGHTRMIVDIDGTKYNCEANHDYKGGQYGHIGSKATKPSKANLKMFKVTSAFRAISKGDIGSEVIKLQKFLKWAGYDCGTADGNFGEETLGAVKSFQYGNGLTADGEFGSTSLAKAKEFNK